MFVCMYKENNIKLINVAYTKIKEYNLQRGFSCDAEDYIFIYRNKRITSQAIDKKYVRYCKELGFVKKGNHKTRKTCLTKIAGNPYINFMLFFEHTKTKKMW